MTALSLSLSQVNTSLDGRLSGHKSLSRSLFLPPCLALNTITHAQTSAFVDNRRRNFKRREFEFSMRDYNGVVETKTLLKLTLR